MSLKLSLMTLGFVAAASMFSAPAVQAESAEPSAEKAETIVTIQAGDTLSAIAEAHGTDYVRIFNANEHIANPDVIDVGMEVRIPNSDEELTDRYSALLAAAPAAAAPAPAAATASSSNSNNTAAKKAPTYTASSAGNTYAYGWCTWYVKSRKPNIPNSWGNAGAWLSSARASGYATGNTPVPGAIGAAGNHVVYVESVSGNNVTISEMAYAGGVGVQHFRTVPASSFVYIYA